MKISARSADVEFRDVTRRFGTVVAVDAPPSPGARTVRLPDSHVALPGLIDAHLHLTLGALSLAQLDLSHVSYTWFNRRHARAWHGNVTLPGRRFTRLHRSPPTGAYLLRHLIKANIRRKPIVVTSGLEALDPQVRSLLTLVGLF